MAYTKTTWETGDTITAELLNHAEQGIYDASPVVITGEAWDGGISILCTVEELNAYMVAGKNVVFSLPAVTGGLFEGASTRLVGAGAEGSLETFPDLSTDLYDVAFAIAGTDVDAVYTETPV